MSDDEKKHDKKQDGEQDELHPHTPDLDMPEAEIDDVDRAPGGVDAVPEESDVGEGEHPQDVLNTPDPPLSAQTEEEEVPDEIQQPEGPDEEVTTDDAGDTPSESPG